MHPFLEDVKNFLLDTLFPVYCLGCGTEGLFLCPDCQSKLHRLPHQECITCRRPSMTGQTHPQCKRPHNPDGLISAFDYHDPVVAQTLIWAKYKFLPRASQLMGKLLAGYLKSNGCAELFPPDTILCPVPLSKSRQRWRGFNQAELICWELSTAFGWPVMPALIQRVKNTKTQKDLTKAGRRTNIANSFSLKSRAPNNPIILVDDVVTTGATLTEACRIIKASTPAPVWCVTAARD
jgi:ComF family protein